MFSVQKIYWLENFSQNIMSCDLNGQNITKLGATGYKARYSKMVAHNGNLLLSTPNAELDSIVLVPIR